MPRFKPRLTGARTSWRAAAGTTIWTSEEEEARAGLDAQGSNVAGAAGARLWLVPCWTSAAGREGELLHRGDAPRGASPRARAAKASVWARV